VVQANILAATDEEHHGEVFNVASQEKVTINQLASQVLRSLGLKEEGNIVHQGERKGDVKHSLADIGKARSMLGYSPAYGLNEGLSITAASMR